MITLYTLYSYIPGRKKAKCRTKLTFDNPNDRDAIKFSEIFRVPKQHGWMLSDKHGIIAVGKDGKETRIIREI